MKISMVDYNNQTLILFQFPFNPGLSIKVQELPRAEWYPPLAGWGVPYSPLAAHLCLLFFSNLDYYEKETHRLLQSPVPQPATPSVLQNSCKNRLHSFQAEGVAYLTGRNAIDNSCPGSGKSRVAICTVESVLRKSCGNALIVCPTSVLHHWEREYKALFPDRSMEILRGKQGPIPARDVLICTPYTLIHKCRDLCSMQWDCVVVDEIHEYRNPESRKTRALVAVTSRASQVIGVTGTIIVNRIRDLFGPLAAIKQLSPRDLHFFETRYCGKTQATSRRWQRVADGFTHEAELRNFLPSCVLHRTREDLGRDLPPLTRSAITVELNNLTQYQSTETLTAQWLATYASAAPPETVMIKTNKVRRIGAIGKVTAAANLIRQYLDQGVSVVVGCSFLEPLRLLERQFSSESVRIDGGVSRKERARRVLYFRESGKPLVALCSTLAAGIGITLTKAQVVLILDLPWSPIFLEQMEARIWREGQTAPCQAIYLLGQETTDKFMLGVLRKKSRWIERLYKDNNAPFVDPLSALVRELSQGFSDAGQTSATGVQNEQAFSL